MKLVGDTVVHHGVPSIVAALRADDHVGLLGQDVDDLALALIPPLPADEYGYGQVLDLITVGGHRRGNPRLR